MTAIIVSFFVSFCGFMILNFIHLEVVSRVRMKSIFMTDECASRIIHSHAFGKFKEAWKIRDGYGNFDSMVWRLLCWKFNHFYPMLEVRLAELEGECALTKTL